MAAAWFCARRLETTSVCEGFWVVGKPDLPSNPLGSTLPWPLPRAFHKLQRNQGGQVAMVPFLQAMWHSSQPAREEVAPSSASDLHGGWTWPRRYPGSLSYTFTGTLPPPHSSTSSLRQSHTSLPPCGRILLSDCHFWRLLFYEVYPQADCLLRWPALPDRLLGDSEGHLTTSAGPRHAARC